MCRDENGRIDYSGTAPRREPIQPTQAPIASPTSKNEGTAFLSQSKNKSNSLEKLIYLLMNFSLHILGWECVKCRVLNPAGL